MSTSLNHHFYGSEEPDGEKYTIRDGDTWYGPLYVVDAFRVTQFLMIRYRGTWRRAEEVMRKKELAERDRHIAAVCAGESDISPEHLTALVHVYREVTAI
jgi:hypothetical protein